VKTIITFVLALCSVMTMAQSKLVNPPTQCRKDMRIDEFLLPEDVAATKATFEELRVALQRADRARVIALVAFPADLVVDGN
jgi:hypothetical protein